MPTSLNMATHLLQIARAASEQGRHAEAIQTLTKLLAMRDLPAEVAEQGHGLLGDLHLREHRYARARRHLAVALVHNEASARYHFLMGRALDWDEQDGDDQEALAHYRRSLELQPDDALCRSALGLLMTYTDQIEEGMRHLRASVEQAPEDMEVRYNLCVGLVNADDLVRATAEVRRVLADRPNEAAFQNLRSELERMLREQAEPPPSPPPEPEAVVTRIDAKRQERDWLRQQRAKPISPHTKLATALARLPSHWLTAMCKALKLSGGGTAQQRRARIAEHLRNPAVLKALSRQLPDAACEALRWILREGGCVDLERLQDRFPSAGEDGWRWDQVPPSSPIGRLQLVGLLYIGTARRRREARLIAVVPQDLREAFPDAADPR